MALSRGNSRALERGIRYFVVFFLWLFMMTLAILRKCIVLIWLNVRPIYSSGFFDHSRPPFRFHLVLRANLTRRFLFSLSATVHFLATKQSEHTHLSEKKKSKHIYVQLFQRQHVLGPHLYMQ